MSRKVFNHVTDPRFESIASKTVIEEYDDRGRFYSIKDEELSIAGPYPSVTTVIGNAGDKSSLTKWRNRIGDREADKISRRAAMRGTAIHNLAENYLIGTPDDEMYKGVDYMDKRIFKNMQEILDNNVDDIYSIELPLWSTILRTAGRVDLVAKWNGELAVIDHKTSLRHKKEEWITNYKIQESCYAYMIYERTGVVIKKIVTIIGVDGQPNADVFVDTPDRWIGEFKKMRATLKY